MTVSGGGSISNPYVIGGGGVVDVLDTPTVDMSRAGSGVTSDPYVISAVATLLLDDIQDVDTAGGATGDVVARQADGSYALQPPTTAPTGAITVGDGIEGDGSGGLPLEVKLAPSSGLILDGTGLRAAAASPWVDYVPLWSQTNGVDVAVGNATVVGRYQQVGKTVHCKVLITRGSTTGIGNGGSYSFSPPPVAPRDIYNTGTGRLIMSGALIPCISTMIDVDRIALHVADTRARVNCSTPGIWKTGDIIHFEMTYEAA